MRLRTPKQYSCYVIQKPQFRTVDRYREVGHGGSNPEPFSWDSSLPTTTPYVISVNES